MAGRPQDAPEDPAAIHARLSQSSDPFARIAAVSADAIITVDELQRIVFFNSGAERIFGWPAADVIGRGLDVLLPARFASPHGGHVAEFGRSPQVARRMGERLPIAGVRRNGEEFPAEASITKLEVEGRLLFTAVLRDVTDRERVQQAQRFLARAGSELVSSIDLRRTLATVVELAVPILGDWCVIFLVEEGRPHRLALAHADPARADVAERLRARDRYMPSSHPARAALDTLTPILLDSVDDDVIERIAPDAEHRKLVRAMGITSAIFVPLAMRDHAAGVICLYSSSGPLGEYRLALAEELGRRASLAIENARLYHDAQAAIQAREELMRIVSHDIGNPLSAIFVAEKVARRALDAPNVELARQQLDGVRQAGAQIARLIEDLLDVERISGGRLRLDRAPVLVRQLVEDAIVAMAPLADEKKILLELANAPVDVRVHADAQRVRQVFSNLIGNALRFTSADGVVRVGTRLVDDSVEFAVSDTGQGIDPIDLPHVFERFYQGQRPLGRGAGLGLTIARGIVEGHGGEIRAESEPGRGSTFFFTLPLA
ncbi:MAG TPA: ATP-binding protein [Longimicrobiales bacterium]